MSNTEDNQSSVATPVALTIAGSDSGGGAGIQADLHTFKANGVHGVSAITCLTAQNPDGVSGIAQMDAAFVREQINQVNEWFTIGAIKTGMLFNADIITVVSDFLAQNPNIQAVVDPVMVATSGAVLLEKDAIDAMHHYLIPKANLFTPNLDEAAVLLGCEAIRSLDGMTAAAKALAHEAATPCLLKGGHLESEHVNDVLAFPDGSYEVFNFSRIEGVNTHGSGCTLSSAIAANMAKGWNLKMAIGEGLTYLRNTMRRPQSLNGIPFIQH